MWSSTSLSLSLSPPPPMKIHQKGPRSAVIIPQRIPAQPRPPDFCATKLPNELSLTGKWKLVRRTWPRWRSASWSTRCREISRFSGPDVIRKAAEWHRPGKFETLQLSWYRSRQVFCQSTTFHKLLRLSNRASLTLIFFGGGLDLSCLLSWLEMGRCIEIIVIYWRYRTDRIISVFLISFCFDMGLS